MPFFSIFTVALAALMFSSTVVLADNDGISTPQVVEGLRFRIEGTNAILLWPSNPQESFVVLWRSNATYQTSWIVLANSIHAPTKTNETIFFDKDALARVSSMTKAADFNDFYRVYVIPDFWFNMQAVMLNGGPKTPGKDFLPFYTGTKETGIFKPEASLIVDGEDEVFGREDIQCVNFGTKKNSHWIDATGFWFGHDRLSNGTHILQIRSTLTLNSFVGQWSQYLTLTNMPVQVGVSNEISFVGFPSLTGRSNVTIVAQSAEPRVNWRIDIWDGSGRLLITKYGKTSNGEIRWTWDLRDAQGQLHNSDMDRVFHPRLTIFPSNESLKGAQILTQRDADHPWWDKRLNDEQKEIPQTVEIPARPLDLSLK